MAKKEIIPAKKMYQDYHLIYILEKSRLIKYGIKWNLIKDPVKINLDKKLLGEISSIIYYITFQKSLPLIIKVNLMTTHGKKVVKIYKNGKMDKQVILWLMQPWENWSHPYRKGARLSAVSPADPAFMVTTLSFCRWFDRFIPLIWIGGPRQFVDKTSRQ